MSYANFKGLVKRMNVKPGNVQEIVIEVSGDELSGQLEKIAQMVDTRVHIELESSFVKYKVEVDAATKEPTLRYKVDETGVVAEVSETNQMELEGLPPKKIETEEKEEIIDKKITDNFILSGLAPDYDGYHEEIVQILTRHISGESYLKLATEFDLSSHTIIEQANKYRSEIAPLAQGWHDYMKSKEE